jgi:hypothetical protein
MTPDEAIDVRVRLNTAVDALSAAVDLAGDDARMKLTKAEFKRTPEYKLIVALLATLQARYAIIEISEATL